MLLKDFLLFFSEQGKHKIKGYKNRNGLVFVRDDGKVFIYREEPLDENETFIY